MNSNAKLNIESQDNVVSNNDLIKPTIEEVKKQELITVLASIIKNYASQKK